MASAKVEIRPSRERPGWTDGGDLVTYVDIPFTVVDTGSTGIVSIPLAQFTAERARDLIQSKADEILKMYQLLKG